MTGRDCDANREAARQAGGVAYLAKPFGSKALLDALETAIHTVIIDAEGRQTENESDRFSPAKVM